MISSGSITEYMASCSLPLLPSSADLGSLDNTSVNDFDKVMRDYDDSLFTGLTDYNRYKLGKASDQEHVEPVSLDIGDSHAMEILDVLLESSNATQAFELGDLGENGSANFHVKKAQKQAQKPAPKQADQKADQKDDQTPTDTPPELSSGNGFSSPDVAQLSLQTPKDQMPATPQLVPLRTPVFGVNTQGTGVPFQPLPETPKTITPLPSPVLKNGQSQSGASQSFQPPQFPAYFLPSNAVVVQMRPAPMATERTYVALIPSPPDSGQTTQAANQLQTGATAALAATPVAPPTATPMGPPMSSPMGPPLTRRPTATPMANTVATPMAPSMAGPMTSLLAAPVATSMTYQMGASGMVSPMAPPPALPKEPVSNKRNFSFVDNIVPENFLANPNNHGRWEIDSAGNRHYLNAPKAKKPRTSKN